MDRVSLLVVAGAARSHRVDERVWSALRQRYNVIQCYCIRCAVAVTAQPEPSLAVKAFTLLKLVVNTPPRFV